jgi:hypothetical protein
MNARLRDRQASLLAGIRHQKDTFMLTRVLAPGLLEGMPHDVGEGVVKHVLVPKRTSASPQTLVFCGRPSSQPATSLPSLLDKLPSTKDPSSPILFSNLLFLLTP